MNEERLRALYQLYLDKEIITKDVVTEEMWMNSSPEQVEGLWNLGIQNELITKDVVPLEMYQEDWGFSSLKKKEDGVSESADGMPVSSEKVDDTFMSLDETIEYLDSIAKEKEKEPVFFEDIIPDLSQMDLSQMDRETKARGELEGQRAVEDIEARKKTAAQAQLEQPEIDRLEREQQEQLEAFRSTNSFTLDLDEMSSDMISANADETIKRLADKYSKYGVAFYKSSRGKITARNADGSNQIEISLPTAAGMGGAYTEEGLQRFMANEAEKLKSFVGDNSIEPESIQDEDYINKSFKVVASRKSTLPNDDGTVSTVRMSSADNFAFPTIFPKDPDKQTNNPEDWIVFDMDKEEDFEKAISLAKERGEIYEFKTNEEADEFAKGGWKDVSITDLEGEKFFKERNLDYLKIRNAERRREEIEAERTFIEEEIGLYYDAEYDPSTGTMIGGYKPSEKKIKENPHVYLKDGTLRTDVREKLAELAKENEELSNVLYFDENTRTAIQDYNVYLHEKYEEYSKKAAEDNRMYDQSLAELETAYEYKRISKDDFKLGRQSLKSLKQASADGYLMANTYLNSKTQRGITGNFEDNMAAVVLEFRKGIQNGNASAKLLALSLGLDPKNKYTANELAEIFRTMDKRQGRAFYTYMNGATAAESFDAFLSNPLEVASSMVANSFAQMLPVGYEIVSNPEIAIPIVAAGMTMGAGGGIKGMVASTAYNLQAATSFALEYGNSIMDAGRQKYNLEDGSQVLEMFKDKEVWEEGARIGKRRGLAIGLVDRVTASMSGRVFKTAETASRARKTAAFLAERMVFDPLGEGLGEFSAQVASGQEIEAFEIINEMMGGPVQNLTTGALNVFIDTDQQAKIKLAYDLTTRDAVAKERSSFNEISNWTSRMQATGQIDQDVADAIQENLVLRNEARDLLGLSKSKKSDKVVSRTMDLLKAQKTLSKDENSRKVYKDELSSIDSELSYMVKNGNLAPQENMTDISNIKDETGAIVSLAPRVNSYSINGKKYSKASFLKEIDKMSEQDRKKATFKIVNDDQLMNEIESKFGVLPAKRQVQEFGEAVAQETYQTIDEVPTEIQEAATVIEETEDGKYRIGEEVFDEIPSEVIDGDAVITQKQDGTIDVQYKEDKFIVESKPMTEVYDTREAIPQTIRDAASTQIVENDEGKFEVTYKESEVIGQVLGQQKERPSAPQFMMGEDVSIEAPVDDMGDIDYEAEEKVREIAKKRNLGITSDREIAFIARDKDGKVIGGAYTSYDNSTGEYTFDVVVDESVEGEGVGSRLLDEVKDLPLDIEDMNPDATVKVDVVNPQMQKMLEKRGFEVVEKTGPNRVTMMPSSKQKQDAQLQLDTKVDTEARKAELEEQAIQQMEEVLPETSETVEAPPKGVIPIKVKENSKLASKLKRVGLDFLIGKKINLVMADQLKVSRKYMGGPFFPLINNLFGKVAWASMDNKAAGAIVNGAMQSDYSVVYNMSPKAIFSNKAIRMEILNNLPPEQQQKLYKLIKGDEKFKKTKKNKKLLEKSNNLKEMFDLMDSKEIKFNVEDKIAFLSNIIPSQTVEATSPIYSLMQENSLNLEQILPNVQEQFAGDLPMGSLTMILEVRTKETKTYNAENEIPSEVKNDPSTKIKKISDNKYEVTSDRRIKDVVSDIESDVNSGKISKKEGNKRKKEAKENAIISKEQQKEEGLKSHPNYAIYIRGRAVSLLKETLPFWNLLKSYRDKVSEKILGKIKSRDSYSVTYKKKPAKALVRINEDGSRNIEVKINNKKVAEFDIDEKNQIETESYIESNIGKIKDFSPGKKQSAKQAEAGAMGSAMKGASRSEKVLAPVKEAYEIFVDRLSKALPGLEVITSQKEFDALISNIYAKKLINKNQTVYGAVYEGKLYLNPNIRNFNTPIHEFGHIWLNTVKELRRDLYDKGVELIQEDDTYINQIKSSKEYKKVIKQMKEDGKSQAEIDQYILEEALATAIGDKGESFANAAQTRNFKGWLTDLFNFVKKLTGISTLSANEIKNMTLDQFLQGVVVDLLSDNELFKEAEVKNLSNQLQMMSSDGSKMSMSDIISSMRQEGFSDQGIKEYLKSQKYKAEDINKAMAIYIDMNTKMPDAFVNVFGGSKTGIQMFEDIKKSLNNWLGSRYGKGKSFTEYRKKALDLLVNHDSFKSQTKIDQDKLISAMDTIIGRKSVRDISGPLKSIKKTVSLLRKNNWKGNIKKAKVSLTNALKPLQGSKIHAQNYKKAKAIIKSLNKDNFESRVKEIEAILDDIVKENKAVDKKLNKDVSDINKKIVAYNEGKRDRSKTLKEISDIAKGLMRGTRYGNIFNKIIGDIRNINEANAQVKLEKILNHINEFYVFQQSQQNKTDSLVNTITSLKEKIKAQRSQAAKLKQIKLKVAQDIKKATRELRELGVENYTYSQVQRLVYKVNNATEKNIDTIAEQIAKVFEEATKKHIAKKKKDIRNLISDLAKKKKRGGRPIQGKPISAAGQEFYEAADRFMDFIKDKSVDYVNSLLQAREILNSLSKEEKAEALKTDAYKTIANDLRRLDKIFEREAGNDLLASIPEMILGIDTMTLEELNSLEADMLSRKLFFASQLAAKKAIEKEAMTKLKEEAAEQIKEDFDMLYKEEQREVDGEETTVIVSKNSDELKKVKTSAFRVFKDEGFKRMIETMMDRVKLFKGIVDYLGHLGTIANSLDNAPNGRKFFTEQVYNRLKRAYSRYVKSLQQQLDHLNDIAATVNPNYTYDKIKSKIYKTATIEVNGDKYTGDQQMRIYALSKNKIQREKLKKQGFTDNVLSTIEDNLGPDLTDFADLVVDYLSDEYYNQVNIVYRDVNNVNLTKVENYFPTKTVRTKAESSKEAVKILQDYADGKFTAQNEEFLKDRVDRGNDVAMLMSPNNPYTFTGELDNLIESSERYKAYAKDAKTLNNIFSSQDVSNLLQMTGLRTLTNQLINNEMNPVISEGGVSKAIRWMFNNFIGVKLGFKSFQVLKQGSSFVMALPEYQNQLTKFLPKPLETVANIVPFLYDVLIGLMEIKQVMNTSPLFRQRVNRFIKSGVGSLETTVTEAEARNAMLKIFNSIRSGGQAFTGVGDIIGVMGYWANYRRDIKQGMDPQEALQKFEDYNTTQQSQRAIEMNRWQLASRANPMWLTMTTFASMPFLLMNVVMQSSSNISKIVAAAKTRNKPQALVKALLGSKDGIRLMFALGLGNAIFAATSQMFRLMYGGTDDEKEAEKEILYASVGYTNAINIPFFGMAIESAKAAMTDDKTYGSNEVINPGVEFIQEIDKALKNDKKSIFNNFFGPKKEKPSAINEVIKYSTGINTDPFIGIYDFIMGDRTSKTKYKMGGISKSQQPTPPEPLIGGKKNNIVPKIDIFKNK